jgi:uncharacterized protein YuzE
MRIEHDPRADAAYIYVVDFIPNNGVARTVPCDPHLAGVNLHFDHAGHLVGIEVMGASKRLSPEVLQRSTKI